MDGGTTKPIAVEGMGAGSGRAWPWQRFHLSRRAREELFAYVCISPWLINFIVFVVGAMVASFVFSLFDTNLMNKTWWAGLNNYTDMFEDKLFWKSLTNTAYYSFAMVPLGTAFAMFIALLLNQGIKVQGFFRTVYYLPSIVSGVAVSLLWAWMYHPDYGLINGLLDAIGLYHFIPRIRWIFSEEWAIPSLIIMSIWGTGGAMLIFLAGLQGIPTALYEAATIDGAGALRRFWNVTIPMLTPTILFSVIMRIIGSFQVFTQAYIMTKGGPNNATLTQVLYIYNKAFLQFHFGYASALAWALFVIILVFTLLVIRSSDVWVYYEGELKR
jgi:multiple sugar transport system permease protein